MIIWALPISHYLHNGFREGWIRVRGIIKMMDRLFTHLVPKFLASPKWYTPVNQHITLEHAPFEDVSPAKNGDFPASHEFSGRVILIFSKVSRTFNELIWAGNTVDGNQKYGEKNQLRLVVDPNIHKVLAPSKLVGLGTSERTTNSIMAQKSPLFSTENFHRHSVFCICSCLAGKNRWFNALSNQVRHVFFCCCLPLKLPTLFRQWSDMWTPKR